MKLLETTLYPHPILNEEVDDFLTGIFRVTEDITVEENIPAGTVEVAIAIELKQPEIEKLIEEGIIALDVLVTCDDTFYSKLHPLEIGESVTRFSNGELNGLVKLQPIIHAKKRILKYKSTDFNEEYGDSEFLIELGDPLGWTVPTYISVGQQKLKPLNTIFDIAIDSDLEDGEIQVDLAMPNITLRVNKEMAEHIKTLRQTDRGRAIVLNSIYLPTVMYTLDQIWAEPLAFSGRAWFRFFNDRCTLKQIDLKEPGDTLAAAIKLLKNPYTRIQKAESTQ